MTRPIGVFDSGIGGLTVVREVVRELPGESLVFLGDTARVPYGTRGEAVIRQFARELTRYLLARDVKCLVAACNTISSTCLEAIEAMSPVPVIGVVRPAVREAVALTRTRRIGVIGTRATVASGAYEREIGRLAPDVEVISRACPLFVPLAEEGLTHAEATRLIARDYLADFASRGIDVLVLGCTHYPLLRDVIQEAVGPDVRLVDSARPTARELAARLRQEGLAAAADSPSYDLLVTDAPQRTGEIARAFFGGDLPGELRQAALPA
ncbi:MAG TPA: glutamate racemase [Dehalococcoidia bacterium]|nr:glutamate racemase [Dehalococcoidia bacterium]